MQQAARIGEAAREVGIHPNTIRALEQRGLIECRRDWAGARRFTPSDIRRLRELVGVGKRGGGKGRRSRRSGKQPT
jgi:DNA-binding transcriptional MerR regulator